MKNFQLSRSWPDDFANAENICRQRTLSSRQLAWLAAVNYAVFGILDIWAIPSALYAVWLIRVVEILFSLLIIWASRKPWFLTCYTRIMLTSMSIWGGGIVLMVALAGSSDIARTYYPYGLMLANTGCIIFTILPALRQAILSIALIIAYFFVALVTQNLDQYEHRVVLLANMFFLLGTNVLVILGSAQRNYFLFKNFQLSQRLVSDLEKAKTESRQSQYSSEHDPLTGLLNRKGLMEFLKRSINEVEGNERVAVLFIDLDGFKEINDNFGHAAGDRVLMTVAQRAAGCCRGRDIVGRLGGDEFVTVANIGANSSNVAARMAEEVIDSISQPMREIGDQLRTSASIGIAIYPDDGADAEVLLSVADRQMYRAKKGRLGWASLSKLEVAG